MNRAAWTESQERSNLPLLRIMTWLSLRLGRRVSRVLLHGIVLYFVLFSPAACAASRDYLCRVLGRPARWRDVYRHILTFATTIHDRIYLLNEHHELFDIRVEGDAFVRTALADGRGAFLIGAHLGSFEAIRAASRVHPALRIVVTMYEENSRRINAVLSTINPAAMPDVIALGRVDAMLKVRERLDENYMVGILADRTLLRDAGCSTRSFDFLGASAAFPIGPLHMAALLKRPVIFMTGLHRGGNRYDIHFEPLADFSDLSRDRRATAVEDALRRYVALLEQYCRAAPYNWFNYFEFWQDDGPAGATPAALPASRES